MTELIHGLYTEGEPIQDTKTPPGPIDDKWSTRKFEAGLVNPANRRKLSIIIVGTGLAVLSIVAAALMRRPFGVTLGWIVQVLTLASALVVSAMLVVGLIFLAMWIAFLIMGSRIDEAQADRREGADGPVDRVDE